MDMLKVFEKAEFGRVRVVECEGEPCFVTKDVCECLELTDVSKTISLLDDDEKGTNSIRTLGGEQQMLVISEPASRKPRRSSGGSSTRSSLPSASAACMPRKR